MKAREIRQLPPPKGPPPRLMKPVLSPNSPSINGDRYAVKRMPPLKKRPSRKRSHTHAVTRAGQLTAFGKLNQMKVGTDGYYGELLNAIRFAINHVIEQQGGLSKRHRKSVQGLASVFFTHSHKIEQLLLVLQTLVEAIYDGLWILLFQPCLLKATLREVLKQHPIAMVKTRLRLENLEANLRRERISGQRQRAEYVSNLRAFKDAIDTLRQERDHYKTLCEASQDASALVQARAECDALRKEKTDLEGENKTLTERVEIIKAERDTYLSECDSLDKTNRTQAKSLEGLGKEKAALLEEISDLSARLSKYESTSTGASRRTLTKKRISHRSSRASTSDSSSPPPLPSDDDDDRPPPLPPLDDDIPPPLSTDFFKAKQGLGRASSRSSAREKEPQQVG